MGAWGFVLDDEEEGGIVDPGLSGGDWGWVSLRLPGVSWCFSENSWWVWGWSLDWETGYGDELGSGVEQEVKREDPEEGGEEGQESSARKVEGALCRPHFQEQLLGAVGWGWGGSSGQFCRALVGVWGKTCWIVFRTSFLRCAAWVGNFDLLRCFLWVAGVLWWSTLDDELGLSGSYFRVLSGSRNILLSVNKTNELFFFFLQECKMFLARSTFLPVC